MPTLSYQSKITGRASALEAADTTSSEIFLSRGVADSDSDIASSPAKYSFTPVASLLESSSNHVLSFGEAARIADIERLYRAPTVADDTNNVYSTSAQSMRRSRYLPSTDGGSASPLDETNQCTKCTNRSPIADSHFNEERGDSSSSQRPCTCRVIDKSNGKEVERGRSLEKGSKFPNPLARAESRLRRSAAAVELDARPMSKRPSRGSVFFEDPTDPCAILDDKILEPCPAHISMCSRFSEVLDSPGRPRPKTASQTMSPKPLIRTLTTVFNHCRPHSPVPILFPGKLYALQREAESQSFSVDQRSRPQPPPSLATGLPTEVSQQIFYSLHPADFNSARHTCRSWFINSLERLILETMLNRGGWSARIVRSVGSKHPIAHNVVDEQNIVNEEWQMSKRLSRECALGPDWTGNGLGKTSDKCAFVHTSTTDFTDVAVHYPGLNSSGTVFTVSCCGKFLMAANGCLIYIYELNKTLSNLDNIDNGPGTLRPVTSILCPRRVLACSMDTSSHRYAVAVLLDGRMGLVCEISSRNMPHLNSRPRSASSISNSASFLDRVTLNSRFSSNLVASRSSSELPFVFPGIASTPPLGTTRTPDESCWQDIYNSESPGTVRTEGPRSGHSSFPRAHVLSPGSRTRPILPPHVETESETKSMPIESGPRSLYRNLCSDDDPPRSVAICPQRRCVAFGCSAGIELHWIDALTGQDLSRWFPLTAPSDYLFFLPPRKSVDSAKKLRLISSTARPGERAAISERAFGGKAKNGPLWERLGWRARVMDDEEIVTQTQGMVSRLRNEVRTRELGSMDHSDHFHAIPLSDGYHILFTDPSTGLLCLGSDAPVGGPTKLLRTIWFQGPAEDSSPVAYAAGSDLRFGVRVVAAFGNGAKQRIWLYSVPGDVFTANSQSSQTVVRGSWLESNASGPVQNLEWIKWRVDDGLQEWVSHSQDPVPGVLPRSVWPMKIKGQEIDTFPGVVDLAVDSGPNMTIWAFSNKGVAKTWQINDGNFNGSVIEKLVARDGSVREVDGEGDVEMSDSPPSSSLSSPDLLVPPLPLDANSHYAVMSDTPSSVSSPGGRHPQLSHQPASFDGTASLTISSSAVFTARAERHYRTHRNLATVSYDAGSDILMGDLQDSETEEGASCSFDEVALAQAGNLVYETSHRSESVHFGRGADFVEELTGIARIDIEIR